MDNAPTREPGIISRRGTGRISVALVAGQSALLSALANSPLTILVPRPRGPSVWAYLSSFGGGLVAGDETRLDLAVGSGASCFLSTQSSTKVYRNRAGLPCGQELAAQLAPGSLLILAPDPVQAFAGAAYRQRQQFQMAATSGLVVVDWLSAGRAACGERWIFEHYASRTEVFLEDRRVFLDSLCLDPRDGPAEVASRMGRFNCLALVLVLGDPLREAANRVLQEIAARPVTRRAPLVLAASAHPHGVVLRLAGESIETVGREIQRCLAFVPALLQDDPWFRKW